MGSDPLLQEGVVIVSAPQGSGKTRWAKQLQEMFGCAQIIDGWDGKTPIPAGALVLTHLPWPSPSSQQAA